MASKIHVRAFAQRSYCGSPSTTDLQKFSLCSSQNQCQRCAEALKRRGYDLNALRRRYADLEGGFHA